MLAESDLETADLADDRPKIELNEHGQLIYKPDGPELDRYLHDRSRVCLIRGPIGSGTSTASCMRIYATGLEQAPGRDGVRRTRWAVVRPTYPQLQTATLKTWLFWFPEHQYGVMNRSRPMTQTIRVANVEIEVWFLALDGDDDIKKLLSTEFTGIWFNELELTSYEIFREARSRTSRYPPIADGGPTWYGVIGDMNAPNEEHWLVRMTKEVPYPDDVPEDKRIFWPFEETDPRKRWTYIVQPGAVLDVPGPDGKPTGQYDPNPAAENTKWLVPGYYADLTKGNTRQWIRSRLMNHITFVVDGDPVWQNFDLERHTIPKSLPYVPGREVIVSIDPGRTRPAALIAQEIGNKLQCQREFRMYNVGAEIFAPALKRYLAQHYPGAKLRFTGDPKGRDKGSATESSAWDIFASFGMQVTPAPVRNNNLDERLSAVSYAFETNHVLIGQDCITLRAGCAGKYHYVRTDRGDPEPFKDKYSDICDCLQYLCLFIGEGRRMLGHDVDTSPGAARISKGSRSMRRVA